MADASSPKLSPFVASHGAAEGGGFTNSISALKPKAEAPGDDTAPAAAVDQLAEPGDAFGADEILARVNHRRPCGRDATDPLGLLLQGGSARRPRRHRRLLLGVGGVHAGRRPPQARRLQGLLRGLPVLQFVHFTSVQAVLNELGGAGCTHVLDFDINVGEKWASLMRPRLG